MLLAYLDEIGNVGAFVSHDHPRFNTSPAFGYGGFVLPEERVRDFGREFVHQKGILFAREIAGNTKGLDRNTWEVKGSYYFDKTAWQYPQRLRVFDDLVKRLTDFGGRLFYYAAEKPFGTDKQVARDLGEETPQALYTRRQDNALRESLNRLARYADHMNHDLIVVFDQINEKERKEKLHTMYGHIFGRSQDFPEMRRIIEPPMHLESALSANVQFADWIAGLFGRAIDYQLLSDSSYRWVTDKNRLKFPLQYGQTTEVFVYESVLHLFERAPGCERITNSQLLNTNRLLYPADRGSVIDDSMAEKMRRVYQATQRNVAH